MPPPSSRRSGRSLLASGLGARVLLSLLVVAVCLGAFEWLERTRMLSLQQRLLELHNTRVLPLRDLKTLSDLYAVRVVDTIHKAAARDLDAKTAADVLTTTLQDAHRMRDALRKREMLADPQVDRLIADADAATAEALDLLGDAQVDALARWRETQLYPRVDPLTAVLQTAIDRDVTDIDAAMGKLQRGVDQMRIESALVLVLAGLIAVALGALATRRVVDALGDIGHAVNLAARGDLSARANVSGTDELAGMAQHVNQMIEAVAEGQTTLKQQAERLAISEQAAQAANKAKSIFLSAMSHELRTPLNVILGHAQILRRETPSPAALKLAVDRVEEAGTHLLSLIDDVLSLSRFESGKLQLRQAPFDPAALLDEVVRMLSVAARAKSLPLDVHVEDALPAAVIGDKGRLAQVMLNLGGNALKFTAQGRVELRMGWSDDRLRVSVIDSGPGMSQAEQATLFDAFSQGSAGHQSSQGSGLGLYISRHLVELMHGTIRVQSAPGQGARFDFDVAAPRSDVTISQHPPAQSFRVHGARDLPPQLVVDDRLTNREVLCALLRACDFNVVEAESAQAALEVFAAQELSLVWMDIRMPGMDGFEALKRIRASFPDSPVPVVAITASVIELDETAAKAAGFAGLATKPFREEAILRIMERLLPIQLEAVGAERATSSSLASVTDLSHDAATRLLKLLMLGDQSDAIMLVQRELNARGTAIVAAIEAFNTDRVVDALKQHIERTAVSPTS